MRKSKTPVTDFYYPGYYGFTAPKRYKNIKTKKVDSMKNTWNINGEAPTKFHGMPYGNE